MALTQVQGGMLASGEVSSTQLADSSVTSSKIAAGAVGPTKLSGAQSGDAPVYAARAWVNFNGTGTVAIRASGNVSSITDNGTGDYTVNFTTAMQDANYGVAGMGYAIIGTYARNIQVRDTPATSSVRVVTDGVTGLFDVAYVYVSIFR
jgi:hypothetical protein